MKKGFISLLIVSSLVSRPFFSLSQARSYQVNYTEFRAELPEEASLRDSLEAHSVYSSLSSFEKDFIYFLNYVRIYPKTFLEKAVKPYLEAYPSFKPVYGESLVNQLGSGSTSPILLPGKTLLSLARNHAQDLGKHNLMSHNSSDGTGMQQRFQKVGLVCGSECINMLSTGSPLEALLSLLVDYKVQGFGHRKSLLSTSMKEVGVGKASSNKGLQYTVVDLSCD